MASRLSSLAQGLRGSVIMQIAGDVRALVDQGKPIANLTVGDFDPRQFPIPGELSDALVAAIRNGETNYPQAIGMDVLRRAIRDFYSRRQGLEFAVENIVVGSGIRPAIYAVYRSLVDPGDRVVFGVPQWNNDYYVEMMGAEIVAVDCDTSTNFLPTAAALRPVIKGARLLALNSPSNPTGTMFTAEGLAEICDLVLEENARRGPGERPLFVMYDQVYWMLNPSGMPHVDPISLRPAMREYTIYVDGISKCFAATGLRVGWGVAPVDVIKPMNDVIGHSGAWAPRAEQIAVAEMLNDDAAIDRYMPTMCASVKARTDAVYDGINALRADGLPVEAVDPQGAMYVSTRFALHGMQTPDGKTLRTDEDVRSYLLHAAGLGVIPFSAFGTKGDRGWFRISVGVISVESIEALMPRLRTAIGALTAEATTV